MTPNLLATPGRRRLFLAALYVCEGAPIGYLWTALPTKLRLADVPVEQIATLGALLTLPWTFKFMWAPAVDAFRSRRFGLRPWIAGAQLAMAFTILPLAREIGSADLVWLTPVLLVHAVCAATQDVAIDALAVRHLAAEERGRATGWMQAGMVLGRVAFGGVALWAESYVGAAPVVGVLAVLLAASASLVVFAPDSADAGPERAAVLTRLKTSARILLRALRLRSTLLGLAFAASAGAGMEALAGLAGPLLVDQGLDAAEVGRFLAVAGGLGLATGSLFGGFVADRVARTTAAGAGVVLVAAATTAVAFGLDLAPVPLLLATLAVAYVLFGMLTAATYALMMDLTDPRIGGTQFSAYMGAVNLCYVWSIALAGRLVVPVGYRGALLTTTALSLCALVLIPAIRGTRRAPLPAPG